MMGALLAALFPDDGKMIWKRRIAFGSAVVANVCFIHAAFGIEDIEKVRAVMDYSVWLLGVAFSVYGASQAVGTFINRRKPAPAEGASQ